MMRSLVTLSLLALWPVSLASGSLVWFTDHPQPWKSAVGAHSMIDFIGWPDWTIITDQYSNEGITFTNLVQIDNSESYPDGSGLVGWDGMRFTLEVPHYAIAVEFLGYVGFSLLSKGKEVGYIEFANGFFEPRFVGLISEEPFDEVYLFKPQPPFSNNLISIDNVYWGMPQGDLNGDGVVNVLDLLILLGQWGTCDDEVPCPADLNNDGAVNLGDLIILLGNWG